MNFIVVLDNLQWNVQIKTLEQHAHSELMSEPKLTVQSGKTAKITASMENRYPLNYGDTHLEVGIKSDTSKVGEFIDILLTKDMIISK